MKEHFQIPPLTGIIVLCNKYTWTGASLSLHILMHNINTILELVGILIYVCVLLIFFDS